MMINPRIDAYSFVAERIYESHPNAAVSSPYNRKESEFPAVTIELKSNVTAKKYTTTDGEENGALLMFETQIYSNKSVEKEKEAWAIAETVCNAYSEIGFNRIQCEPFPVLNDATVFRIVCRHRGTAIPNDDGKIYIYLS